MVKSCVFFAVRTEILNYLDELRLQRVKWTLVIVVWELYFGVHVRYKYRVVQKMTVLKTTGLSYFAPILADFRDTFLSLDSFFWIQNVSICV
jgi:hypothetical protein